MAFDDKWPWRGAYFGDNEESVKYGDKWKTVYVNPIFDHTVAIHGNEPVYLRFGNLSDFQLKSFFEKYERYLVDKLIDKQQKETPKEPAPIPEGWE